MLEGGAAWSGMASSGASSCSRCAMQSDALPDQRKPKREYRGSASRTRRRRWLIVLALTVVSSAEARIRLWKEVVPPATISSFTGTEAYTPDQDRFAAGFRPALDVLVGDGCALAASGTARNWKISELSVRASRYHNAAAQVTRRFRENPGPTGYEPFVAGLQGQIHASLAAKIESVNAIRAFNWDELAIEVAAFPAAIDQITCMVGAPTTAEGPGN